jgi:hypothetical protein
VALCQLHVTADKGANIANAKSKVKVSSARAGYLPSPLRKTKLKASYAGDKQTSPCHGLDIMSPPPLGLHSIFIQLLGNPCKVRSPARGTGSIGAARWTFERCSSAFASVANHQWIAGESSALPFMLPLPKLTQSTHEKLTSHKGAS